MSVADKLSALATAAAEAAAAMRGVPAAAVPPPAAADMRGVPAAVVPPPAAAAVPAAVAAEAVENLRRRLLMGPLDRIPGRREQVLQPLMAIDISQLMYLRPGGWIRSDDIADALLARDAEVKEHIRNFQAPGAAEARSAAAEAEHNRYVSEAAAREQQERVDREARDVAAAAAASAKEALAAQRKAATEARDAFQKLAQEEARGRDEAREKARRAAVVAANPDLADLYARSAESNKWTLIGREGTTHELAPGTRVRFGKDSQWVEKVVGPEGTITAGSDVFGRDPAPGIVKEIWKRTGGRRRKTRRRKTRHHRRSKTSKRA